MKDVNATELYLTGYLDALIGAELTRDHVKIIMSHIDDMLHTMNFEKIQLDEENQELQQLINRQSDDHF